ncbi:SDR family oxidoreductase [bacterium]|nr:SDR family oxidoreductase [bacterium]
MHTLPGRVAVVTGAASGIGLAASFQLVLNGCHVALVDIDEIGLSKIVPQLSGRNARITSHVINVAERSSMEKLPEEIHRAHGNIHILVNSAGVSMTSSCDDATIEDFQWVMNTNFWSVVFGCKFFLPFFRRVDEAHIVNLSSLYGFVGIPTQTAYCSSKFAIRGFTESLRAELYGTQIGVTCVYPGSVKTNLIRNSKVLDPLNPNRKKNLIRYFENAMNPNEVACKIVFGIKNNSPRIVTSVEAHLADIFSRLSPSLTHEIISRIRKKKVDRFKNSLDSVARKW